MNEIAKSRPQGKISRRFPKQTLEINYAFRGATRALPIKREFRKTMSLFRLWCTTEARFCNISRSNKHWTLPEYLSCGPKALQYLYCGISDNGFKTFTEWCNVVAKNYVLSDVKHFKFQIFGKIQRLAVPENETQMDINDVLLMQYSFNQMAINIIRSGPDWIPFFYRGGYPPGVNIYGNLFRFGLSQKVLRKFHLFPGLSNDNSGCDSKQIFYRELEKRYKKASHIYRVSVIDTTLTGSTAITNVLSIASKCLEQSSKTAKMFLDFHLMFPIEDNVEKTIKWGKNAQYYELKYRSKNGTPARFKAFKIPSQKIILNVYIYPVKRSVYEDLDVNLELGYLEPFRGKPVFGYKLAEPLKLSFINGRHKITENITNRGDPAFGWILNSSNQGRMSSTLIKLGFPENLPEAIEYVLCKPKMRQYRVQGIQLRSIIARRKNIGKKGMFDLWYN